MFVDSEFDESCGGCGNYNKPMRTRQSMTARKAWPRITRNHAD